MKEFKVGDRVQIREWEDMEKEFGKVFNEINTRYLFTSEMTHLCGRTATISKINGEKIQLKDWSDSSGDLSWSFSTDMIKYVEITRDDLQFADILTLRDGKRYVIAEGCLHGEDDDCGLSSASLDVWYNDDLTENENKAENDIVKVERAGQVVYEREDKARKMTVKQVCEELGYDIEIIKED